MIDFLPPDDQAAYDAFIADKAPRPQALGFDVPLDAISDRLKPHARVLAQWGVQGGRRAYFTAFGLHKTSIQLETGRVILEEAHRLHGMDRRGLIVLPLGVRQEFKRDALQVLGWDAEPRFIRSTDEAGEGISLTNYESVREGRIDPAAFTWASLDEASCLRSYGSKTFQTFLPLFDQVAYRHVATATPSPNRYKELIHYAGFLGIMDTGQALTRFFQRNPSQAGDLTLYPHKEQEFWLWVNSWAIFLQKPSDLGFSDDGYSLPGLRVHWHELSSDLMGDKPDRDGQVPMFKNIARGLVDAAREKRDSIGPRVAKVLEIVTGERGSSSLSEGLLSDQSGAAAGEAARPEPRALRGEQGIVQGPERGVEGRQSGADARTPDSAPAEERGSDEGPLGGLVSGESGEGSEGHLDPQVEAAGPDAGDVCGDAGAAAGPVSDLRDDHDAAGDRSLPRDGRGEGSAVPALQCGAGPVQGSAGDTDSSRAVPDQIIIWCDLNDEQDRVEAALNGAGISHSSLRGNQSLDERDELLDDWKARKTTAFVGKPIMYGSGVNMQQAHRMVFAGIGFKAQDILQAIHRIYRFQQTEVCDVHFIVTEAERDVRRVFERKWRQHNEMVEKMSEIIRKYGLNHRDLAAEMARASGVERIEISGQGWTVANNDCVAETRGMETDSVDLIVTSIPFSNHYEYTPNYNDFGHTDDNGHFWSQMDFLTPELLRVLAPGRIAAIHVKDRILFGNVTGLGRPSVSPFHAEAIMHYGRHGFVFAGMITISTDVVRENNQTYRLGYTEMCKDGSRMGVGSPEYLLLFFKPQTDRSNGYADDRVSREKADYSLARWQIDAHAFWRSSGDRSLTAEDLMAMPPGVLSTVFTRESLQAVYDYETHVRIGEALEARGALPSTFMALAPGSHDPDIWHDVLRMLTLNGEQTRRGLENHICPLQFDIVDRAIERWSKPGETVYDPFGGLFTVPYRALKLGRQGRAAELNTAYFMDGVKHLQAMEREVSMPSLFDLLDGAAVVGPSGPPDPTRPEDVQATAA